MALYLYCVRENAPVEPFLCEGIGGKEKVFTIAYKDLDAVVSTILQNAFPGEDAAKHVLEDIKWITEKAQKHEAVLEEAMGSGKHRSVIPLKFGTIFQNRRHLLDSLAANYDRFLSTLKKLEGKQEWHCKVYVSDSGAVETAIRRKSEAIRGKEKEMKLMREGAAYFMDMQIKARVQQEKDKVAGRLGEHIFQTLKSHAEDTARGKILAKELTGRQEPMILNGTFLIQDAKIGESQKTVEHLAKKLPMLDFVYTGPWPPYNFV